MKKITFLFLIVLSSFSCIYSQGWHLVSVPGRVDSGQGNCNYPAYTSAFNLNGYGYVGLGQNNFWRYDPTNNVWEDVNFPAPPRIESISFVINGKAYFGCGQTNELWQLDTTTWVWTQMANYPGTGPIGVYNNGITYYPHEMAMVLGDSAYFGYGSDFYQYTPATNTWKKKRNFPGSAVAGSTLLSINGVGYYISGWTANNGPTYEVWAYYPDRDTFIQKGYHLANGGFVSNGQGYVFMDASTLSSDQIGVARYNDTTDTWTALSNSPISAFDGNSVTGDPDSHVSFSIGSKGYIGSDANGRGIDPSFWEYDPSLDTWTQKANLAQSGGDDILSVTIDSMAYIFGGDNDLSYALTDFWAYNGNSGNWEQKAHFPGLGRTLALGFAINGLFYAGGGSDYLGNTLTDFWVYNPSTDTWTKKDSIPSIVLPVSGNDGGGVSIGGYGFYNDYRYDPVIDSWSSVTYFDFAGRNSYVSGDNICYNLPSTSSLAPGTPNFFDTYNPFSNANFDRHDSIPADIVDTIIDYVQPYAYNTLAIPEWSFVRGGKVDFLYGNLFLEYDTLTSAWKRLPDFPDIVNTHATSFVIGNKIYYGFGDTSAGILYNKLWVYDDNYTPPVTDINNLKRVDIKLYPNPVTTQFAIQSDVFRQTSNISSHIFDMDGREYRIPSRKNGNIINFDAGDLPPGVYIIRIDSGVQQWTKKIVKLLTE